MDLCPEAASRLEPRKIQKCRLGRLYRKILLFEDYALRVQESQGDIAGVGWGPWKHHIHNVDPHGVRGRDTEHPPDTWGIGLRIERQHWPSTGKQREQGRSCSARLFVVMFRKCI